MTAIAFPFDLYPAQQSAGDGKHYDGVMRDLMDDGTPKIRVINEVDTFILMPVNFVPLNPAQGGALIFYLFDKVSQEFTFPYLGYSWTGYIWSDPSTRRKDNQWYITVNFYGKKVT